MTTQKNHPAAGQPDSFDRYPGYYGSDLELTYTPQRSVFTLWAPTADKVRLNLYASGEGGEPEERLEMRPSDDGTWRVAAERDLKGTFYTFQIEKEGKWLDETPGIWAKAVGVNGDRAAVIDLRETDPEGWEADRAPELKMYSDIILYELHHRDFSVAPDSGIENKGKFLALTETGTKTPQGEASGLDHLKELGVTHIHILPSFDYATVDEARLNDKTYNWGYDPKNYNVPEGSYSTDPADPAARIREELSKIDPTIFIYGEGWLAADSPLPPEKRAVRDHVGQMEGIAVFCDDFRDAVRGSTFDEHACGYASGNIGGHYEPVKFGIVGATQHPQVDYNGLLYSSVPYAAAPSQAVNFVASHDGYTVIDKLRLSVTGNRAEEELLPIDKLIHTILLTAQGVPFIRAGEEMMQDKQGEPNSFRSPDAVNQIDWALKAEHRGLFDYIRQLIALRKAHPAFRIPTAEGLRQWLRFLDTGDSGVIAYTLGEHANGDAWKEILVAYNGNRHPAEFRIPEAERIVVCRDGRIDPDSRERLSGEVVRMAPSSALIAYCE